MWAMAGFFLRRLIFGLVATFAALSLSFYYFASKFFPLRGTSTAHAYWVWLRGLLTGRSFSHGLIYPHLLPMVGAAFGRTMLLLALTLVLVIVIAVPVGCISAATASRCAAVGGLISSRCSRGSRTRRLSRAGFGTISAWSSSSASELTALRIVLHPILQFRCLSG